MTSPTVTNLGKAINATADAVTKARENVTTQAAALAAERDAARTPVPPAAKGS